MSLNFKQIFIKTERIYLKKEINHLFKYGFSFSIYPLRIIYLENQTICKNPISILVSVPKKKIKLAVKRNRIKRLIRESYRLTKDNLWEYLSAKNKKLLLAFIYISDKLYNFNQIQVVINKVLDTLKEKIS